MYIYTCNDWDLRSFTTRLHFTHVSCTHTLITVYTRSIIAPVFTRRWLYKLSITCKCKLMSHWFRGISYTSNQHKSKWKTKCLKVVLVGLKCYSGYRVLITITSQCTFAGPLGCWQCQVQGQLRVTREIQFVCFVARTNDWLQTCLHHLAMTSYIVSLYANTMTSLPPSSIRMRMKLAA